jgi:excisionase family DNA binding protein
MSAVQWFAPKREEIMQTETHNQTKYLSSKEAAEELCAHPNTLRRWAKAGVLPHYKTEGGHFRFDVGAYLARVRRDPRAAA